MPIEISGTTETTGAVSVFPQGDKPVCIVARAGTNPSQDVNKLFEVYSVVDSANKFGADSIAIKLVEILITNGATAIKGIIPPDMEDELLTEQECYDDALDKLLLDPTLKIIICDKVDQTVQEVIKTHLDLAESEDIERYAVVGISESATNSDLTTRATGLNHDRMFITGPAPLDINGNVISGIYTAAGLAALIATETDDPALPMNGVEMLGFGGLSRKLLKAEINALVNAGVTPLYVSPGGRPTVHRLVTTYTKDTQDNPDPIWQEGTTRFIADDVLNSVRSRIMVNYKRTKNVSRILDAMKTDVIDVLERKEDFEIIENFDKTKVSVIKDPQDLYGALIDYEFDVVTPLYRVTIRQHMKL